MLGNNEDKSENVLTVAVLSPWNWLPYHVLSAFSRGWKTKVNGHLSEILQWVLQCAKVWTR